MNSDADIKTDALAGIRIPTDSLGDDGGHLTVESCRVRDLIDSYGSPLYVFSERTLRANIRRIRLALAARWSRPTRVLYAIKANNALAICAIAHAEGAGSDCFGLGEMHATFEGGADPATVVLNGSSKSDRELAAAVESRVRVNLDSADEIGRLARIARAQSRRVRVGVRLKVQATSLNEFVSDYDGGAQPILDQIVAGQWGFSTELAISAVREILSSPELDLEGYHVHTGRMTADPAYFAAATFATTDAIAAVHRATGYSPAILDMGGGFPRQRDPESRSLALNPHPIESYLDAVSGALREGLAAANLPLPELWIEPGRYIVGNAGLLAGTVGSVKRDLGRTWVHVDFSVNQLMRIDILGYVHHVLAAERLREAAVETVDIVGSLCAGSPIAVRRPFPRVDRGDLVAVLDAGMYAETLSTQFNGVPRPASVLINGASAEIIRSRETVRDVFSRDRIPTRLRAEPGPSAEPSG